MDGLKMVCDLTAAFARLFKVQYVRLKSQGTGSGSGAAVSLDSRFE